jgi:hypothetical protein
MFSTFPRAIAALTLVAAVAGALTVLPGGTGGVSANAPLNSGKGDRLDARAAGTACSEQAWPYFEAGCIKDRRQPMSQAKSVRIVTPDRTEPVR